jgi:hypothetical protein
MGTNPSDEFPLLFYTPSKSLANIRFSRDVACNVPTCVFERLRLFAGALHAASLQHSRYAIKGSNFVTHIDLLNIFEDQNNPADELFRINKFY